MRPALAVSLVLPFAVREQGRRISSSHRPRVRHATRDLSSWLADNALSPS